MSTLGNRMKAYENVWHTSVPPNSYVVLRLDGRAFRTLLRNADKPHDHSVAAAMWHAAKTLCEEIPHAEFAYLQSDEISILMTDIRTVRSQLWFDGDIQKLTSVSASIVSSAFNNYIFPSIEVEGVSGIEQHGHFDARVLTLPHPIEVANYFVWRQRDARRNAAISAAREYFPHVELHRKNIGELRAMLHDVYNITFPDDYPSDFVNGRILYKTTRFSFDTMVERTVWAQEPAPQFWAREGNWLAENIPAQPAWLEDPTTAQPAELESDA